MVPEHACPDTVAGDSRLSHDRSSSGTVPGKCELAQSVEPGGEPRLSLARSTVVENKSTLVPALCREGLFLVYCIRRSSRAFLEPGYSIDRAVAAVRDDLGGFLFYWIGWCLLFPLVLLRPHALVHLFRNTSVRDLPQWPHPFFKSPHRMTRYDDVTAAAPLVQGREGKQRNGYVTPSTSSHNKR
jgi:hypothetical protein